MAGSTVGTPTPQPQGVTSSSARVSSEGTTTVAMPIPSIKIPKPEKFKGERAKLQPFLVQMDMHTTINANMLGGDEGKIIYVVTHLEGAAFGWVEPAIQQYYNEPKKNWSDFTKEIFTSYNKFKEVLEDTFGDIDKVRTAERQLQELKQTGSAA